MEGIFYVEKGVGLCLVEGICVLCIWEEDSDVLGVDVKFSFIFPEGKSWRLSDMWKIYCCRFIEIEA